MVKRDDLCGAELSGNKTRKLEFLVAEALAQGADVLVTAGAVQSNHCRATAAAAAAAGLRCALLLRCADPAAAAAQRLALPGNLLLDRLLGARCFFVSEAEYAEHGSDALLERLRLRLLQQGAEERGGGGWCCRRPYVIPVGGSNSLGAWGYIECIAEVQAQLAAAAAAVEEAAAGGGGHGSGGGGGGDGVIGGGITDIAFACGSGGTAAGLALGAALSAAAAEGGAAGDVRVHAFMVCDDEREFREHIGERIAAPLLLPPPAGGDTAVAAAARAALDATLVFHEAEGAGYGASTAEELRFLAQLARDTGMVLDPTYGGKAFFALARALADPAQAAHFRGRRVLFVHTGGLPSWFAKERQLAGLLEPAECERFVVGGGQSAGESGEDGGGRSASSRL
jgi:1-aminocyclopropane-1-carboxylate deaminase/D-cysteine desulfhydrase-like pyridoxal-dependent ACC family enzyme